MIVKKWDKKWDISVSERGASFGWMLFCVCKLHISSKLNIIKSGWYIVC